MSVEYVSIGGVFIDDIVYPDGRTIMEVLGGGATHAAAGMTVWDVRPGVVISVGNDLSSTVESRFDRDFDTTGLHRLPYPQARAWQLFEWDGRRTELYRVETMDPFINEPYPEHVPDAYTDAQFVYMLRDAVSLPDWQAKFPNAELFWEPLQQYMVPENAAEFREYVHLPAIVSPNLLEAQLVYGLETADALLDAMLTDGAKIVALRMGENGSIVADANQRFHIPAVPVNKVIDQTGAGNTYCGAFLVGWGNSRDSRVAGEHGAVAASFAIEQVGVLEQFDTATRDSRLRWLIENRI
jgi:sugar/nucleoside kinase (ribokinase family)